MSSRNKHTSPSSSEDDEVRYAMITDEKKRKRMISNRESARRSRIKREQHIQDLNDQVAYFRTRSGDLTQKINEISRRHIAIELENRMLRMHGEDLSKRLELLEGMLAPYNSSDHVNHVVKYSDEYSLMDILQEPWLQQPQTTDGIYMF